MKDFIFDENAFLEGVWHWIFASNVFPESLESVESPQLCSTLEIDFDEEKKT